MKIGIPKETKPGENRVAATPAYTAALVSCGVEVLIQSGAGVNSGYGDELYEAAEATIVESAENVWSEADLVIKVKEPLGPELELMRDGQAIFAYFHLAAEERLTNALLRGGVIAIAFETLTDRHGRLPLLEPMSEVAGRLAIQRGAACLESANGGPGVLLPGTPSVPAAQVLVLGGGTVGTHAARVAAGMGAGVTILDIDLARLRHLAETTPANITTSYCNRENVLRHLHHADLVIGAVLIPGDRAPVLVEREDLACMKRGSVVVDVAIDQGGCFASSRPTSHAEPTYEVDGVIHYCVPNMPGGVARTSTQALADATLPFSQMLASQGINRALIESPELRSALNIYRGLVTNREVAKCFDLPFEMPKHLYSVNSEPNGC